MLGIRIMIGYDFCGENNDIGKNRKHLMMYRLELTMLEKKGAKKISDDFKLELFMVRQKDEPALGLVGWAGRLAGSIGQAASSARGDLLIFFTRSRCKKCKYILTGINSVNGISILSFRK